MDETVGMALNPQSVERMLVERPTSSCLLRGCGRATLVEQIDAYQHQVESLREALHAALTETEHADECPALDMDSDPDTCICWRRAAWPLVGRRP